jgi:cytochrome o ubiquinol oxidase subunit 3
MSAFQAAAGREGWGDRQPMADHAAHGVVSKRIIVGYGFWIFLLSDIIQTACLLLSSFACGLASIGAQTRRGFWFYGAMAATFMLGAAFVGLEAREFAGLVARGAGPTRSAFLSAFFTLVGCHGLHVTVGLLWLLTMMAQVFAKGYRADILRRMLCFSLFWHTLDIIWVALFTVVYLMGAGQ